MPLRLDDPIFQRFTDDFNERFPPMADKSDTITRLEITHNPVPYGQGFSLSAHVDTAGPNRVHGDVEFFADGESIATLRTDSTGVAAHGIGGGLLPAGEHEFSATFHGDGYNGDSTSEPLVAMLTPAPGEPWPTKDKGPLLMEARAVEHDPRDAEVIPADHEPPAPLPEPVHEPVVDAGHMTAAPAPVPEPIVPTPVPAPAPNPPV